MTSWWPVLDKEDDQSGGLGDGRGDEDADVVVVEDDLLNIRDDEDDVLLRHVLLSFPVVLLLGVTSCKYLLRKDW